MSVYILPMIRWKICDFKAIKILLFIIITFICGLQKIIVIVSNLSLFYFLINSKCVTNFG